jgi:uncharacterized membrane protein
MAVAHDVMPLLDVTAAVLIKLINVCSWHLQERSASSCMWKGSARGTGGGAASIL